MYCYTVTIYTLQEIDKLKYIGGYIRGRDKRSEGVKETMMKRLEDGLRCDQENVQQKNISTHVKIIHYKATMRNTIQYGVRDDNTRKAHNRTTEVRKP